jgi:Ca-activated chloride channel family protein
MRRLSLALGTALVMVVAIPIPLAGRAVARQARGDVALLLILDASGSMQAALGGGTRIAAAKGAVRELVGALPRNARVGLRVYGSRVGNDDPRRDCRDSELLAPVRRMDRARLRRRVGSVRARGFTPIGLSLMRATHDLVRGGSRNVILVSDGIDTCAPPPPCKVARRIHRRGLHVDVVGLVTRSRARRQLRCIASAGGGRYVDASSAEQLAKRLRRLSLAGFEPYDVKGAPVQGGGTAEHAPVLLPGRYVDVVEAPKSLWYGVELVPNQSLTASATVAGRRGGPRIRFGFVAMRLYSPDERSPISARDTEDFKGLAPANVSAETQVVGLDPASREWSQSGVYLARVTLEDAPEAHGTGYPVELDLSVQGKPRPRPVVTDDTDGGWMLVTLAVGATGLVVGSTGFSSVRRIVDR